MTSFASRKIFVLNNSFILFVVMTVFFRGRLYNNRENWRERFVITFVHWVWKNTRYSSVRFVGCILDMMSQSVSKIFENSMYSCSRINIFWRRNSVCFEIVCYKELCINSTNRDEELISFCFYGFLNSKTTVQLVQYK